MYTEYKYISQITIGIFKTLHKIKSLYITNITSYEEQ